MSSTRYSAAWLECGCLLTCGHAHESVGGAVACIRIAGAYVVAVDFGTMRSLDKAEEAQYQSAVVQCTRRFDFPLDSPALASPESIDSRYAVMTRIRVRGQWTWTTWMCFRTHADAARHAWEGDRVVRFRSAEWHELRRQTTVPAPSHAGADAHLSPTSQPTSQDETLVEAVFRWLDTCGFDERPPGRFKGQRPSKAQEGVEQDEIEEKKRA